MRLSGMSSSAISWLGRPVGMLSVFVILLLALVVYAVFATRHSEYIYRSTLQADLMAHVFQPPLFRQVKGAVLFLHGGGWWTGSRRQFVPYSDRLTRAGYVVFTVDYRVHGKHGTGIEDALTDATAAWDWMLAREAEFGFADKPRAIGGGSAGGHLAACIAVARLRDPSQAQPDALLLMNPVLDISIASAATGYSQGELMLIDELSQSRAAALSPMSKLDSVMVPTLITFGTADPLLAAYQQTLKRLDSTLFDIKLFAEQGHGFFNKRENRRAVGDAMLGTLERMSQQDSDSADD